MVFGTLPVPPRKELLRREDADEGEVTRVLLKYGLGRTLADEEDWDIFPITPVHPCNSWLWNH
jgi:hypothetical protein